MAGSDICFTKFEISRRALLAPTVQPVAGFQVGGCGQGPETGKRPTRPLHWLADGGCRSVRKDGIVRGSRVRGK